MTEPKENKGKKIPLGHGKLRDSTQNMNLRIMKIIKLNIKDGWCQGEPKMIKCIFTIIV